MGFFSMWIHDTCTYHNNTPKYNKWGLSSCPIAVTQAALGHMDVGHMWGPFVFVEDSKVIYAERHLHFPQTLHYEWKKERDHWA